METRRTKYEYHPSWDLDLSIMRSFLENHCMPVYATLVEDKCRFSMMVEDNTLVFSGEDGPNIKYLENLAPRAQFFRDDDDYDKPVVLVNKNYRPPESKDEEFVKFHDITDIINVVYTEEVCKKLFGSCGSRNGFGWTFRHNAGSIFHLYCVASIIAHRSRNTWLVLNFKGVWFFATMEQGKLVLSFVGDQRPEWSRYFKTTYEKIKKTRHVDMSNIQLPERFTEDDPKRYLIALYTEAVLQTNLR